MLGILHWSDVEHRPTKARFINEIRIDKGNVVISVKQMIISISYNDKVIVSFL